MADLQTALEAVLGGAYRIERELGGGGMSRVFLAEDAKLRRRVVIKVLPTELAQSLSTDRFQREVQLAASLQHPHIVPLLTADLAADTLYYTMPFIEGESLRAKLARDRELPITDAVRILRDVADALAYAHEHGVVHRDIKPDNVLLSGRHAVVTDFGVAKAVSQSTGDVTALTSAGVALGTPAYMAPEQASADPHVDHRADIYAFGALAYEMLTGRPPFSGGTPQAVLAAHVTETPEPVTKHRAAVPPALADLVMRCLEKKPADRWQSAGELHLALDVMATPSGGMEPTQARPSVRRPARLRAVVGAGAVLVVVLTGFLIWRSLPDGASAALDPNVVAILPFRVAGADPSLGYLREGMMDLLATKFTGGGGPRAADPRSVMAAFRRVSPAQDVDLTEGDAARIASDIGAGQLLLGGVVGSTGRIVLSASLVAVPAGGTRAQANVEGPSDSLASLVDRLATELLARGAGATRGAGTPLTTDLEALKAYIAGQAAFRHGAYDSAIANFSRALGRDSSFVLSAFGLAISSNWGVPVPNFGAMHRALWRNLDRLSDADRALVEARLGEPGRPRSDTEVLRARERAVQLAGDRADAWYMLGDFYFHSGLMVGIPDAAERAAAAFRRALAFDSSFAAPLDHLVELAARSGDTATVRRGGELYMRQNPTAINLLRLQWSVAVMLGDGGALERVRRGFDTTTSILNLMNIARLAQVLGTHLDDIDPALDAMGRRATTSGERNAYVWARFNAALNRGRPREAARALSEMANPTGAAELMVRAALYGDGDTSAARQAVERSLSLADAPLSADSTRRQEQLGARCVVEQWRVANGNRGTARDAIERLRTRASPPAAEGWIQSAANCATLLETMLAVAERGSAARPIVERFDSLLATGPVGAPAVWNLAVARLLAESGSHERAYRAATRRDVLQGGELLGFATGLREQGRLAALAGNRDAAVLAYSHYLSLMQSPEPEMQPIVEQVKADLGRLMAEGQ